MHSGDNDAALRAHERGESFGATRDRFYQIACSYENWIVSLNGRGKNNKLRGICMFRKMLFNKAQTEPLQSIRFH